MKIFKVLDEVVLEKDDITCFLAGGIADCKDWQNEVIKELSKYDLKHLVLFNPRMDHYDATKISTEDRANQIAWGFEQLEKMDIFSMYFCNSTSVQPICMYELGRNLLSMQYRFPKDYEKRILITIENGYSRQFDVEIQSELALGYSPILLARSPREHALKIKEAYEEIKK